MKYTLYRIFIYILSTDLRNFVLEKESLQIEKKNRKEIYEQRIFEFNEPI